jgi:hypothetical protein
MKRDLQLCRDIRGQAGYLDVRRLGTLERPIDVVPLGLTWNGHDFLDNTSDGAIWKSALKKVGGRFASVSLSIVKQLCVAEAQDAVTAFVESSDEYGRD